MFTPCRAIFLILPSWTSTTATSADCEFSLHELPVQSAEVAFLDEHDGDLGGLHREFVEAELAGFPVNRCVGDQAVRQGRPGERGALGPCA